MIEFNEFTRDLETWYKTNGRDLPWRKSNDPYCIWVSEIMSHQTQIERVAENFYPRFIEKFPTVHALAQATWEEVFPVWEGLGYYQRGKNMIKTAEDIVHRFDGIFPEDPEKLITLKGIGPYTSSAIASFAFDQKVPAIDTNVSKIVSVLWPHRDPIDAANSLITPATSGKIWNSAMMDLASQLRLSQNIAEPMAQYFPPEIAAQFKPQKRTRKKPGETKPAKPRSKNLIEVGIACIHQDGKYLIQSRPKGKSFVGFWEFPGGKRETGEDFRTCVKREIQEEIGVTVSVRPHFLELKHKFGPKTLLLRFHRCQIQAGTPAALENQEIKWVSPSEFDDIKFLKTNHKVLAVLKNMRV